MRLQLEDVEDAKDVICITFQSELCVIAQKFCVADIEGANK